MERLNRNYLHRWWIPLATVAGFFVLLVCLIPYSSSLGNAKLSLGGLILSLCKFGRSTTQDAPLDYTYCLFVPVIVGYLVYLRRKELMSVPVQGSNFALILIALGILLYWFGLRAEVQYFGYVAVQILLAGLVIWLWGMAVFRIVFFPWAFFFFAWPLPFLDPIIAFPLRMVMSHLASLILPLIGIPCVQNGTALLSAANPATGQALGARFQIDIADPCSGIRSLFALLMFSALLAYLFLPRLWQQWLVFLSAIPLAIVGNLVRVLLLVIGSIWFGTAFAIGTEENPSWFHEACGLAIYVVAIGLEFILATWLTRDEKQPAAAASDAPVDT